MQIFHEEEEEEEEEELLLLSDLAGLFPFFLLAEGLDTKGAESLHISDVSISIRCCFTTAYDKLSFVVKLSITFL